MKKLILLAGVAALASCGDTAATNEAAPAGNDMAMEPMGEEEAMTAPDGGPVVGTYSMRDADGNEMGRTTINADMTYTRTWGDETESGTFSISDDGPCFHAEGAEEAECYPPTDADSVAEDGSWPMSGDEGGTIIRVEA